MSDWFDYLNYDPSELPTTIPDWDVLPPTDNTSENSDPYGPGSKWGQDTLSAMGISNDTNLSGTNTDFLKSLLGGLKTAGGKALDFAQTPQGIMAILAALASRADRARPSGGGTSMAYQGYRPLQRTLTPSQTPGAPGPIARYAAEGGLMRAYAQGGTVQMEDGGFVMTKRAVDGAGGPQGIARLVPGARMIGGPPDPTGKRDLTPAVINGPRGQTPARVSRGEAYVPKAAVDSNGGSKALYALMNGLQRRA